MNGAAEFGGLVGGMAVSLAALFAMLATGWMVAATGWRDAERSTRMSAALLLAVVQSVAFGQLLLFAHAFAVGAVALPFGVALTAARRLGRPAWALARDARRSPVAWAAAPLLGVVAARLARALVAPQLSWDALTYHLYRAGAWIQHGGFTEPAVPDAWGYYLWYPVPADTLWAWAMLGHRTDTLVGPIAVGLWGAMVLAAWAAARTAGAPREGAALAALAAAGTGAAMSVAGAAYVDNLTVAIALWTALFLARYARDGHVADGLTAATAAVLGIATKASLAPAGGIAFALLAWTTWRRRVRPPAVGLVAAAALAVLLAVPLVRAAWVHHNPFYPFPVRLLGHELFAGDPEMRAVFAGAFVDPVVFPGGPWAFLLYNLFVRLEYPGYFDPSGYGPHLAVALLAVPFGAARAWRRPGAAPQAIFGLAVAGSFLVALVDPAMAAYRNSWAPTTGRLLLPALALVVLPLAHLPRRAVVGLAVLVLPLHAYLAAPRGWRAADLERLPLAVGLLAVLLALAWLARRAGPWVVAALPFVAGGWAAWRVAQPWTAWFREASFDAAYDYHLLQEWYLPLGELWDLVEREPPSRLAVGPSFVLQGQNVYLYPWMGRRLQHELVYVPITTDGHVVPLALHEQVARESDGAAWLRRVEVAEVDLLFLMGPSPAEDAWVRERPDVFRLLAEAPNGAGALFRVDRAALAAALR